jgi:hypothetical protein
MFWLLLAWAGITIVNWLINRNAKSKIGLPQAEPSPDVPAGTPIPVAFGTVKIDPLITEFSHTLKPWKLDGQQVGWRRIVTYMGVLTWGPITKWVDIIFDDTKSLIAQPDQRIVVPLEGSYPPATLVFGTPGAGGIVYGSFGDPPGVFAGDVYAEIYLPNIFGGKVNGGEGGIQAPFDGIPDDDVCAGRAPIGGSYNFFWGDDRTNGPMDDRRHLGGVPVDGSCDPDPTTSGPGRVVYPRLGYVYLQGVEVGTSPQLKRQQHVITAMEGADAGGDINPAIVVRNIWTNVEWGLGISPALIDIDDLNDLEDLLHDEGFGISGVMAESKPAEDYLNEIYRTADLVAYRDPATGLLRCQAIRGGYSIPSLQLLDESNVSECEWERRDIADTLNEVSVRFTDRARQYNPNVVTVQNHANIHMSRGIIRGQTFEFPWVTTEALALKLAARELKSNTLPLGHGSLVVDRTAFDVVPGDILRLSWARYGLVDVPIRVRSVSVGNPKDGSVVLEVVEDLYGLPEVPYVVTTDPWTDPGATPGVPVTASVARFEDGTIGEITLTITSGDALVTLVEFSTQSGNATATAYGSVAGGPQYTSPDVALSASYQSKIFWRVTYTDPAGDDATITGTEVFQPSPTASGDDGPLTDDDGNIIVDDDGAVVYAG